MGVILLKVLLSRVGFPRLDAGKVFFFEKKKTEPARHKKPLTGCRALH
jgi:hypothetical protein